MRGQAWWYVLLVGLALMLSGFIRLQAETVTLTSSADTSLFETSPDNNMGGNITVAAGTTFDAQRSRALYKFSFADRIPTNATILSVKLTLNVTKAPSGAVNSFFKLHRVLKDWNEGNKTGSRGATAATGQVTWNARAFPNDLWDAPGAASGTDFSTAASAVSEKLVGGAGPYDFNSTQGLIADVQSWVRDPAVNFGWIVVSQNEDRADTARRLSTKLSGTIAPALTVEYSVAAPLDAPTGLTATGGVKQVALTWNASANATSYDLQRGTNSGGPYSAIATKLAVTAFTDTNVTAGTFYFYAVSAANATSQSALSAEVSATPMTPVLQGPVLEAPQLVGNQFSFRFLAAAGGNYEVQFCTVPGASTWQPLTNIVAKFENKDVLVTQAIDADAHCIYRVSVTPVD